MKELAIIVFITLLCGSCHSKQPMQRTVQGIAYDKTTGKGLNGAFIFNLTRDNCVATDSLGNFKFIANVGDSILFSYVGMKDSIKVLKHDSLPYLYIGLDTIHYILIDKGVCRTEQP